MYELSKTSKQQTKCVCIFAAEPPKPFTFGPFPQTHGVHMNYDQIMMSSTHGGGAQVDSTNQLHLRLLKHVMYTSDSHLAK